MEFLGLIFLVLLIIAALRYDKIVSPILHWFKKHETSIKQSRYWNLVLPGLVWVPLLYIFFYLTEIRPKTNIAWLIIILIGPSLIFGCIEIFWIFVIPIKFIIARIPFFRKYSKIHAESTLKNAKVLRPIGLIIYIMGFYIIVGLFFREIFWNEGQIIKGFFSRHFY